MASFYADGNNYQSSSYDELGDLDLIPLKATRQTGKKNVLSQFKSIRELESQD